MNKRIQELMKSAITDCFDDQLDRDGDLDRMYIPNVFAEKFAELIVRECAGIYEGVYTDQARPERIDTRIKQHFGVEE